MKAMKIVAVAIMAFASLSLLVNAQENSTDKVILATSANYPDAVVSSVVSQKLGIPVLLTESNKLTEEVKTTLQDLNPKEVIMVGGPAAIDDSVETQLKEDYNVTRLWGMSKYGTALEVVEHFWPEGSNEAILVENRQDEEKGNIMVLAKNLANGKPLIPIPEDKIPASVLSQLEQLGVKKVKVVGIELSKEMKGNLSALGIDVTEKLNAEDESELEKRLRDRTMEDFEDNDTLVVAAVGNFKHVISAPNLPQSESYLVSSEEEIQGAVDAVNQTNIQEVKVVGKPDLAKKIAEELENKTDAEVDLVSKGTQNAVQQAAKIAQQNRNKFAKRFRERSEKWEQEMEENKDRIREKANRTFQKVRSLKDDYNLTELGEEVQEVKNKLDQGNYQEALEGANELRNKIRQRKWEKSKGNMTELREEIQEEMKSLREKTQELSQLNREFGQEMRKNMTVQERLEVNQEFHERSMEKVKEIVEKASKMGRGPEKAGKWIEKAEKEQEKEREEAKKEQEEMEREKDRDRLGNNSNTSQEKEWRETTEKEQDQK